MTGQGVDFTGWQFRLIRKNLPGDLFGLAAMYQQFFKCHCGNQIVVHSRADSPRAQMFQMAAPAVGESQMEVQLRPYQKTFISRVASHALPRRWTFDGSVTGATVVP